MKQPDIIIFIEKDEIGMFLAESILSAFEPEKKIHYFSGPEEAMDFLKSIKPSANARITFFVNAVILLGEEDLIRQIKSLLLPFSYRFCLLTSLANSEKREKSLMKEMGLICSIEKPLTEEKFAEALKVPFTPGLLK